MQKRREYHTDHYSLTHNYSSIMGHISIYRRPWETRITNSSSRYEDSSPMETSPSFTNTDYPTSPSKIIGNSFLLVITTPASRPTQKLTSSTKQMKRNSERTTTSKPSNISRNSAASSDEQNDGASGSSSVGVLVGLVVGTVFIVSSVTLGVYLYRRRDEGTYKIDENSVGGICNSKPLAYLNGHVKSKHQAKDVEWYV